MATTREVLVQLEKLPEDLKKEALDFIEYLVFKYESTEGDAQEDVRIPHKPFFGCGALQVTLAPDFDASLEDFKEYME